ncbi:9374_t:CDS:2, partial [Funneliformis geosporum]
MKQKNSDFKFVLYIAPKALKEAASSTPAPSSSSTSTSVPTNLDLEIIQEVFGSLPEKITEFEFLDISKIGISNKILTVIPPSNNNNNNNKKVDDIPENSSSSKDRLKLLDSDEYLENDNMEEDLRLYSCYKSYPFAVTNVAATALHMTIPDLKIDTFCDFSQYKADMQFNERAIHVTDIPLQMKPTNIKQVFAKYETVTDFKMTNDFVCINPCTLSPKEIKYRNTHYIKLTNLPFGTSARDLHNIILATKARA